MTKSRAGLPPILPCLLLLHETQQADRFGQVGVEDAPRCVEQLEEVVVGHPVDDRRPVTLRGDDVPCSQNCKLLYGEESTCICDDLMVQFF